MRMPPSTNQESRVPAWIYVLIFIMGVNTFHAATTYFDLNGWATHLFLFVMVVALTSLHAFYVWLTYKLTRLRAFNHHRGEVWFVSVLSVLSLTVTSTYRQRHMVDFDWQLDAAFYFYFWLVFGCLTIIVLYILYRIPEKASVRR